MNNLMNNLDTNILDTNILNPAPHSVRQAYDKSFDSITLKPKPEWVRGTCPKCGQEVIANSYYVGGRGYIVVWECWASLGEVPTCTYRKVL